MMIRNVLGVVEVRPPMTMGADLLLRCTRCGGVWAPAFYRASFHDQCPDATTQIATAEEGDR